MSLSQNEGTAPLKVDLPPSLVQHVRQTAHERGISIKELVAEAITAAIGGGTEEKRRKK